MPQFSSIIGLKIKAATQAEANEIACGAAEHLLDTFNDDASISSGIRYMSGGPENVVIPADLLRALMDAADYGADSEDHAAERNRKDCEHEGAKACAERARKFRRSFREGRAYLNRAAPKPRPKRETGAHLAAPGAVSEAAADAHNRRRC